MAELQQTKNTFKVVGRVTRLDKDGAYKEETMDKGLHKGETYRSLRFGVKTSDTNEITVSMFSYEPTEIFLWNSDKKKKDSGYKGDRVKYGDYLQRKDMLKEQGYAVLQTRVGVKYGDDGKIQSEGLPNYEAAAEIYDNLRNGDTVVIEGDIRYSRYKNKNDQMIEQKNYGISKIFKLREEVDFDAEGFEEVTYFEQEFVYIDAVDEPEEGKVFVTGRVIDYKKNFHDTQFVVKYKDADGKVDGDMQKLSQTFKSRFNFGDVLTVYGETSNRVVLREVQGEDKDEPDLFSEFGGKKKPKHAESFVAKDYIQEMSIEGIEALDEAVYAEGDFVKDELLADDASKNDFGGKNKKANPFEKVESDPFEKGSGPLEISDDDLPF